MNGNEDFRDQNALAIKVRFLGDLPAVVGGRDTTVSLPQGSRVRDLVTSLCERYGDGFRHRVVSQSGALHHDILIFLNGENIDEIGELAARLEGNADMEIIMLPAFEGG